MWSCATQGAIADSTLQYFNPFIEWNPHAPSVVWAMHKFFPENYMGPIGLSGEEENLRAAPGTPQAAQAEGGMLFSKIVPKSNMGDAIQGETFDITLTKGYFTEAKEEARAVGRAAIIPKELECFEQARKVMRLIRNGSAKEGEDTPEWPLIPSRWRGFGMCGQLPW